MTDASQPTLARRLGAFDATMIVMGGIIGAGIFANPANVVRRVGSGELALLAWGIGGALALIGSFVYAELAQRAPEGGGQYAYLRDAYHPLVAFLYGWTLLLVVQTGGMAGAAMIFARYAREIGGLAIPANVLAVGTLLLLTAINCIGVRAGSNVQSALMLLKLAAIAALIGAGLFVAARWEPLAGSPAAVEVAGKPGELLGALVPIMFAYGGWQTASFVSAEMRDPRRDLPRGLLIGVTGVVVVYLLVNVACLRVLGSAGLGASTTPAADVMRIALGAPGARLISLGIAVSTVGFLSQSVLTAPRVYHQMASDGLFFRAVARVHPTTRVPVAAIVLQGIWAALIALTGQYDRILNYVVSIDVLFFGLTAAALFIFRRRQGGAAASTRVPLHPVTTALFVLTCWAIALSTAIESREARLGFAILAAGVPVYFLWSRRSRRDTPAHRH